MIVAKWLAQCPAHRKLLVNKWKNEQTKKRCGPDGVDQLALALESSHRPQVSGQNASLLQIQVREAFCRPLSHLERPPPTKTSFVKVLLLRKGVPQRLLLRLPGEPP